MQHIAKSPIITAGLVSLFTLFLACSDGAAQSPDVEAGGEAGSQAQAGHAGASQGSAGQSGTMGTAGASGSSANAGSAGTMVAGSAGASGSTTPAIPDCGPGCHVVMPATIEHSTNFAMAYHTSGIVDGEDSLMFFQPNDTMADVPFSVQGKQLVLGYFGVKDNLISYTSAWFPKGTIEVFNLTDNSRRVYGDWDQSGPNDYGAHHTALNSTYVFWFREGTGLMRARLDTGEQTVLNTMVPWCNEFWADETTVYCASPGINITFDAETGSEGTLGYVKALQDFGSHSPNLKKVTWVDFRDPPSTMSTYDFRSGGEIYVYDVDSKQVERVTFDSPSTPIAKTGARVNDDASIFTWNQACKTCDQNPESATVIYKHKTTTMLDKKKQRRCTLENSPLLRSMVIMNRKLYGYHFDKDYNQWVIELDIDHPDVPWDCKPWTPGPTLLLPRLISRRTYPKRLFRIGSSLCYYQQLSRYISTLAVRKQLFDFNCLQPATHFGLFAAARTYASESWLIVFPNTS
jgi:hypothetical protein